MPTGLGIRIRNKRIELGMSQEALANKLGLKSKSTICKIERGDDNLTTDTICKYAEALNTTPGYLMGWEDAVTIEPVQPNTNSKAYIKEYIAQLAEKFSNYSPEEIERAMKVFEIYEKSTPEVRASIELLLGSTPRKP